MLSFTADKKAMQYRRLELLNPFFTLYSSLALGIHATGGSMLVRHDLAYARLLSMHHFFDFSFCCDLAA